MYLYFEYFVSIFKLYFFRGKKKNIYIYISDFKWEKKIYIYVFEYFIARNFAIFF